MKKDDANLSPEDLHRVRIEARLALERVDAFGRFPTPVDDILAAAQVRVVNDQDLDEGVLAWVRRKATGALKSALSQVLGLFDAAARLIHIDRGVMAVKQTFIKLHEAGHGLLTWQRKMYAVTEDCTMSLADDIQDLFEREANNFATEVLFQLDSFSNEAAAHNFGIKVPLKLAPRYGASTYASIRRYVAGHERACVVLVLEPPVIKGEVGFECALRRVVASPSFAETVGSPKWPSVFTPDDSIGAMIPLGKRRMSRPRTLSIADRNGVEHECLAEAFTNGYQVFVLIALATPRTKTTIVLATG